MGADVIQDGRREGQVEMQVLGYDEMVLPVACSLAMRGCVLVQKRVMVVVVVALVRGLCSLRCWAHGRLLRVLCVRFCYERDDDEA